MRKIDQVGFAGTVAAIVGTEACDDVISLAG
jgi:hypothetical protein